MIKFCNNGKRILKDVFLTFDDGPNPYFTEKVLNILDEFGVKASFFLLGNRCKKFKDFPLEIKRRGHVIGNHSYSHASDFAVCEGVLNQNNVSTLFVRPPYFDLSYCLKDILFFSDRYAVLGDARTYDYTKISYTEIIENCKRNVQNGSILTLHDGSDILDEIKDRPKEMLKALPFILEFLLGKYSLSTLSCERMEWINF